MSSVGFVAKATLLAAFMGATYVGAQRVLATWYVDDLYPKFTGTASGLEVGTSRESDGVVPSILEECLAEPGVALNIENFAFAYGQSDYGEMYLDAIRRKLDPDTEDGVFTVGGNPASLSQSLAEGDAEPDDSRSRLAQMENVTADPNLEYIRRFYGKALYKGFTHTGERFNLRVAHPDGWIEVRQEVPDYAMSDSGMAEWRGQNIDRMTRDMPLSAPSTHRMEALGKVLELLGQHGRVWMIRMPIHPDILALEQEYWPDFSETMADLARSHGVEFFDYSGEHETFPSYDGSHLFGGSARAFTRRMCGDLEGQE